ncbi:MAG: hypothetical protein IJT87_00910 [Ruminiclostridium sp.]|nr:hypothetical protein [Ruminiclostridium sp.]
MRFGHEPDEYIKNLAEYKALDETKYRPSDSKPEVIRRLKETAQKKKEIAEKQDDIIREYIEPFENGAEKLDSESAEKLEAFLDKLTPGKKSISDVAVSLRLCRLLYSYFHEAGDRDKTIDMIFLGTLCERELTYYSTDGDFFEFPKLCEEFCPVFEELSEHRQVELAYAYSFRVFIRTDEGYKKLPGLYAETDKMMRSFVDRAVNKKAIEIQFLNMTANFASFYCDMCRRNDDAVRKGGLPLFDTESAVFKELFKKNIIRTEEYYESSSAVPYIALSARNLCYPALYHLGCITFDELMEKYGELRSYGKANGLGLYADLTVSSLILCYLYYCSPYEREKNEQLSRDIVNELIPRILEMKKAKERRYSWDVAAFLSNSSFFGDFSEFYDIALSFTVYMDKALYVHTVMVKEICRLLLSRIMEEDPGFLNGVCGKDAAYITEHKKEMLDLMDRCAMCHDIGKHFLIDVVSNSSRRLTDDEYAIIRSHPKNFEIVYDRNFSDSPVQKCIRDCALLHHRWHNGRGGYPDMPHTENRPYVDIIAIADSLDAATDLIGRPYGVGKSLDDLIGEFSDLSGTRYSGEVAGILSEPDVKAAVQDIITSLREEVNYRIYAFDHYDSNI